MHLLLMVARGQGAHQLRLPGGDTSDAGFSIDNQLPTLRFSVYLGLPQKPQLDFLLRLNSVSAIKQPLPPCSVHVVTEVQRHQVPQ